VARRLIGQLCYETDTKKFKIGDGATAWNNLAYSTLSWADITNKPTTFAPSAHTHTVSDITTGTLSDDRLSDKARAAINLYLWSIYR
jgi:hypothetical protein